MCHESLFTFWKSFHLQREYNPGPLEIVVGNTYLEVTVTVTVPGVFSRIVCGLTSILTPNVGTTANKTEYAESQKIRYMRFSLTCISARVRYKHDKQGRIWSI